MLHIHNLQTKLDKLATTSESFDGDLQLLAHTHHCLLTSLHFKHQFLVPGLLLCSAANAEDDTGVDIETNWFWIAQTFLAPAAWCPAQLVCSVCAVHGNSALCLSHFHNSTVQCGLYTTVHNCTGPCLLPQQNYCTVHTTSSFYRIF